MTAADEVASSTARSDLLTRITDQLRRPMAWVLIDQGVVSLGNFITANRIAYYLPKTEYGIFSILLETMLYLNSIQAAPVIYPLTIKGACGDRSALGRIATAAIVLTFGLLPVLGCAMTGSVAVVGIPGVAIAAIAAMLFWQIQETLRRGLISDFRYKDAVWGDGISYLGQAAAIICIGHFGLLSLHRAYIVMAVTSVIAVSVQSFQIGLSRIRPWQLRLAARDFWRLGRWMLPTNAGAIITSLGYWWTLKGFHGLDECAVYGAIALLFKLANPVINCVTGLITPAVARSVQNEGMRSTSRAAIRYTAFGAALLAPYFLALALFAGPLLELAYGKASPYIHETLPLRLFIANYVVVYFLAAMGAWLAGLGRSRYNFYAQIVSIVVTVAVGLPLTRSWGTMGLIIGGLISAGGGAVVTGYFIHRVTRVKI